MSTLRNVLKIPELRNKLLFTLLMMDQFDFPGEDELLACVSLTVGLSILLHGLSATPLATRIGRMAD